MVSWKQRERGGGLVPVRFDRGVSNVPKRGRLSLFVAGVQTSKRPLTCFVVNMQLGLFRVSGQKTDGLNLLKGADIISERRKQTMTAHYQRNRSQKSKRKRGHSFYSLLL